MELINYSEIIKIKRNEKHFKERVEIFKKLRKNFKMPSMNASKLLKYLNITDDSFDIDVEDIVKKLDINLKKIEESQSAYLEKDEVANVIFNGEEIIIRYKPSTNKMDGKKKNRFAIAHELGHIFLHFLKGKGFEYKDLKYNLTENIPRNNLLQEINMKASLSYKYENKMEYEADEFAEELLVQKKALDKIFDEGEDISIEALANKFQIPKNRMFIILQKRKHLGDVEDIW